MKSLNVISGSGEIFPVLIPENGMAGKLRYAVELMNSGSSDSGISLITAALEPLFPRNYRTALHRITAADAFKLGSALAELFALTGTETAVELSLEVSGMLSFRNGSVPLKPAVSGDIAPETEDFFYNGSLQITDKEPSSGTENIFPPAADTEVNCGAEREFFPVADPGYIQPGLPFTAAEIHTDTPEKPQRVAAEKTVWNIPGAVPAAKKKISIFSDPEQWQGNKTFSFADIPGSAHTGAVKIAFPEPDSAAQNFVCGTDTPYRQRFEYCGEGSRNLQSPYGIVFFPEKKDDILHTAAVVRAVCDPAEEDLLYALNSAAEQKSSCGTITVPADGKGPLSVAMPHLKDPVISGFTVSAEDSVNENCGTAADTAVSYTCRPPEKKDLFYALNTAAEQKNSCGTITVPADGKGKDSLSVAMPYTEDPIISGFTVSAEDSVNENCGTAADTAVSYTCRPPEKKDLFYALNTAAEQKNSCGTITVPADGKGKDSLSVAMPYTEDPIISGFTVSAEDSVNENCGTAADTAVSYTCCPPEQEDPGIIFRPEPLPAEKFQPQVKNIPESVPEISDRIIAVAFAFKWTLEYTASLPEALLKRCMAHAGIKQTARRTEQFTHEPSPEEISRAVQRGKAALEKVLEKLKKN